MMDATRKAEIRARLESPGAFAPPSLNDIRDLLADNDALEARIADLEGQIEDMENASQYAGERALECADTHP